LDWPGNQCLWDFPRSGITGDPPPGVPAGAVAGRVDRARATAATPVRGPFLYGAPLPTSVLPDITVLGPYTYLATEILFGSVAAALLYRARAGRRAARTIAALYPVAYVWDWYTLEVGVFAIPMRTGVELLGIPVEEHLFIVVVPAFVLGIHETLHGRRGEPAGTPRDRETGDAGGDGPATARDSPNRFGE
jgi:lycopene cyclase domain-containing protein